MFCETWRGEIIRHTFSNLKQHAAIVTGLYEWFERIDKDHADEYEQLLQIRGEIARKELETCIRWNSKMSSQSG